MKYTDAGKESGRRVDYYYLLWLALQRIFLHYFVLSFAKSRKEPGAWPRMVRIRKNAVELYRLSLGHTRVTHHYLVYGQVERNVPACESCKNAALPVERILIECDQLRKASRTHLVTHYDRVRRREILNGHNAGQQVLNYLKCIGCYSLI